MSALRETPYIMTPPLFKASYRIAPTGTWKARFQSYKELFDELSEHSDNNNETKDLQTYLHSLFQNEFRAEAEALIQTQQGKYILNQDGTS